MRPSLPLEAVSGPSVSPLKLKASDAQTFHHILYCRTVFRDVCCRCISQVVSLLLSSKLKFKVQILLGATPSLNYLNFECKKSAPMLLRLIDMNE